ncbi:MAG: LCP family protein [Solobacterium sp.]|nr:LCP family protein [Solobacterium sp.]
MKTKKVISAKAFWIIALLASIALVAVLLLVDFIPNIYALYASALLTIGLCILFILSAKFPKSIWMKGLNILFSIAVGISGMFLTRTEQVAEEFFKVNMIDKHIVNAYVMNEEYKKAHSEYFSDVSSGSDLESYKDKVFIISDSFDRDDQEYALRSIEESLGTTLTVKEAENTYDALKALYTGEGDVLIMTRAYESLITETEEFREFKQDVKEIHTVERLLAINEVEVKKEINIEPFALFFAGNDQEGELILNGRTDVNLVVFVNPKTGQLIQVSLPRDSYIPNPALGGGRDKLTHLGVSGIENTMNGIGEFLDTEINKYILVNFTTFRNIVDALGGIEVDNPYAFAFWDNQAMRFEEGRIKLDGMQALLFCRERKTLPNGDFGRNMHQQMVMQAIIEKACSPEMIPTFGKVVESVKNEYLTNLEYGIISDIIEKQLLENTEWNIISYKIEGGTGYAYCASYAGQELSVVFPDENYAQIVREEIKKLYNDEILEQR